MSRVSAALRRRLGRWLWPEADAARSAQRVVCHEWLAVLGGSDKVAAQLTTIADAEVLVTFAVDDACLDRLDLSIPVVTWRFGRWAGRSRRFQLLLPVMPLVWGTLDLGRAELVVTSSHSCVNAVHTPNAHRVSYCHTPMRYAWCWHLERHRLPPWARPAMAPGAALLRRLDRGWSGRVDQYVANSTHVAERIRAAYGQPAVVVPPPVDVERFCPSDGGVGSGTGPFVAAGRLVAYKRFDVAVEAANRAQVPLVVAGDGPESARLQRLAGPTVEIREALDDQELIDLLRSARAFVHPGVEDFGMLPVEAQACGRPVIARGGAGADDSVRPGVTGELVTTDEVATWAQVLATFELQRYDPNLIRKWAEGFAPDVFHSRMAQLMHAPEDWSD